VYTVYEVGVHAHPTCGTWGWSALARAPLLLDLAPRCATRWPRLAACVRVDPAQMFHTRYSLFKQIYLHKATKAIEYMITDAMVEAGAWSVRGTW
jgi:hypothetical protein